MNKCLSFIFVILAFMVSQAEAKSLTSFLKQFSQPSSVQSELNVNDDSYAGNKTIESFSKAKQIIKKNNYLGVKKEIYCGCDITGWNEISRTACGFVPDKESSRASKIEMEHLTPFENLAGHTTAWDHGVPACKGKKGRACASIVYGYLEADLWNLLPSIGSLNMKRSNFSLAEIPGEVRKYGKCDFEVEDRKVEPPNEMKALMVYNLRYMQETYAKQMKTNYISNKNEKLLDAWEKMFKLSKWQCDWAKQVIRLQGNENKFMTSACKQQGLW